MLAELLTCDICKSVFDEDQHAPYTLGSCGHTFCIECIRSNQSTRGQKSCFICKKSFTKEENVHKNYTLTKVVEYYHGDCLLDVRALLKNYVHEIPTTCKHHLKSITAFAPLDNLFLCSQCSYKKMSIDLGAVITIKKNILKNKQRRLDSLSAKISLCDEISKDISVLSEEWTQKDIANEVLFEIEKGIPNMKAEQLESVKEHITCTSDTYLEYLSDMKKNASSIIETFKSYSTVLDQSIARCEKLETLEYNFDEIFEPFITFESDCSITWLKSSFGALKQSFKSVSYKLKQKFVKLNRRLGKLDITEKHHKKIANIINNLMNKA